MCLEPTTSVEGSEVSPGGLAASHSTDCLLKSSKHRGLGVFATFFSNGNLHGPNSQGQEEGVPGNTGAWNKGNKGIKLGGGTYHHYLNHHIYKEEGKRGEER